MKRISLILFIFLFIQPLFSQGLKNGKFYCKTDSTPMYAKEEWTLRLFSVNVAELSSKKVTTVKGSKIKKEQLYKGLWEQNKDTIVVDLDFKTDSLSPFYNYKLTFIRKGNDLVLLNKSKEYSDIFYGQALWMQQAFIQTRKSKIRARF